MAKFVVCDVPLPWHRYQGRSTIFASSFLLCAFSVQIMGGDLHSSFYWAQFITLILMNILDLLAVEDYTWIGIFAPGGTPPAIINKINASVESILAEQEFRDRLTALGFDPVGGSPASFSAYVKSEVNKWAKVIKETGAIKE